MPIHVDLQFVVRPDQIFPHPIVVADTLRREMALLRLTPRQRQQYQGRWFHGANDFADRAAHVRGSLAELLHEIPYTSGDMQEQRQRVAYLEAAQLIFAQLSKDVADSLLKERAVLFTMASAVLKHSEELLRSPFRALEQKMNLDAAVGLMRKDFDRRNKKISKTKRARAARTAEPEATRGRAAHAAAVSVLPTGGEAGPTVPLDARRAPR